jgi:hypothetical protein
MQSAYDGLAAVGKANAAISLFWTHLYAGPFALLGLYGILRPRRWSGHVVGRVDTDPRCGSTPVDDTSCVIRITYRLPGDTADRTVEKVVSRTTETETLGDGTSVVHVLPLSYVNGQAVDLYYEPSDPQSTVELTNDDWRPIGGIVFAIAAFFLLYAWIKFFLTQRFSALAAMSGANTVKSFASDIIRPASNAGSGVFLPSAYVQPPNSHQTHSPPPTPSRWLPRTGSVVRIDHQRRPSVATVAPLVRAAVSNAARVTQLLKPYRRGGGK